jgi:hypothetical protein
MACHLADAQEEDVGGFAGGLLGGAVHADVEIVDLGAVADHAQSRGHGVQGAG